MDKFVADFIRNNIKLIDGCQFEDFLREVDQQRFTISQQSSIYQMLYKAGIDILPYVTRVPKYYMLNADIEDIVIPSNIKVIDQEAFAGSSLESVTISEGVTMIKDFAFNDCKQLKSLVYPNSVKAYGEQNGLASLTEFNLPKTIIAKYTILSDCENLKIVRFRGDKDNTHSLISGCAQLETVEFLEGTTNAWKQWWRCGTDKIINIYLPHSCTYVDWSLADKTEKYRFYVYKDSNADLYLKDRSDCKIEYRK